MPDSEHSLFVQAWLARAPKKLPREQWLLLFESALDALWQRTVLTLGEVTLTAIVDRVIYTAAQQHPFLASLTVGTGGFDCEGLRQQAGSIDEKELAAGLQFLLVEFLEVQGRLTAEILTPALHEELSKVTLDSAAQDPPSKDAHPKTKSKRNEGAK